MALRRQGRSSSHALRALHLDPDYGPPLKTAGGTKQKRQIHPFTGVPNTDKGSARNFRRLVAEQKVLWRRENAHVRRPAVWSPGEYLVIDWAEEAPGLFVVCAVLACSRWRFARFAADQKASTHPGDDRRDPGRDR